MFLIVSKDIRISHIVLEISILSPYLRLPHGPQDKYTVPISSADITQLPVFVTFSLRFRPFVVTI